LAPYSTPAPFAASNSPEAAPLTTMAHKRGSQSNLDAGEKFLEHRLQRQADDETSGTC
jgi:hypothetical protein